MESRRQADTAAVPPHHVLPALLPLSASIHRDPALIVTLTHAEVYPSGCALFISLRANVVTLEEQTFLGQLLAGYAQDAGEFTVAIVKDGQRQVAEFDLVKEGGLFYRINVSGGSQHFRMSYWLTPLPGNSCALLVRSPLLGIDSAEVTLDPHLFADAARRAEELWPGPADEDQAVALV